MPPEIYFYFWIAGSLTIPIIGMYLIFQGHIEGLYLLILGLTYCALVCFAYNRTKSPFYNLLESLLEISRSKSLGHMLAGILIVPAYLFAISVIVITISIFSLFCGRNWAVFHFEKLVKPIADSAYLYGREPARKFFSTEENMNTSIFEASGTYYLFYSGRVHGPHILSEIRQLYTDNSIPEDTLCRRGPFGDWILVKNLVV